MSEREIPQDLLEQMRDDVRRRLIEFQNHATWDVLRPTESQMMHLRTIWENQFWRDKCAEMRALLDENKHFTIDTAGGRLTNLDQVKSTS